MASLFEARPAEIRPLEAGAVEGALIAAFVKRLCGSVSTHGRGGAKNSTFTKLV